MSEMGVMQLQNKNLERYQKKEKQEAVWERREGIRGKEEDKKQKEFELQKARGLREH